MAAAMAAAADTAMTAILMRPTVKALHCRMPFLTG